MSDLIRSRFLAEIAEVVGTGPALRLASAYGGQEDCSVPKTPRRDHPWVEVLGWDAFIKLCDFYGGGRIDIPRNAYAQTGVKVARPTKARRMARLKRQGYSHRAIARRLGCTERYVRMTLNRPRRNRQLSFWPED